MENFGDMMKKVTYVDVFQQLLNKHEQMLESENKRPAGADKFVSAANGYVALLSYLCLYIYVCILSNY